MGERDEKRKSVHYLILDWVVVLFQPADEYRTTAFVHASVTEVSYTHQVKPILERRCVVCPAWFIIRSGFNVSRKNRRF